MTMEPNSDKSATHSYSDILTMENLHKQWSYSPPKKTSNKNRIKESMLEKFSCSPEKIKNFIVGKLPILDWIIGYNYKEWLMGDVIAGITVAIMHIPLGMAFALLAHIDPVIGIYMAFFQVLIYAFFGTSRHCSMGSFAVITLMTGKTVKALATFDVVGTNITTDGTLTMMNNMTIIDVPSYEISYTPIQVATVVCFTVGVWHMIFGLLQMGLLVVFLSDMLVSGFTTAAAVHVLTSQIKFMLGLEIQGFTGPLKIIYTYIEIFKNIHKCNVPTLITSMLALVFLIFTSEIIKPRLAKYTKIPLPSELIVVIVATLAARYGDLSDKYNIRVVGEIKTGLPPPVVPPLELFGRVAVDSFVIAIVSFVIDYSVAKIFAIRKKYNVDATQELYAHGITNIGSSFFACPPMSAALARTIIQESVGGVTQMASFVCCFLILLVLLFIGPFFQTLPNAILSSIIAVVLKGMFVQFTDFLNMWKVSKIDAASWMVTFLAVVIIDIDLGLLVGILFSLFVLLAKNQSPKIVKLGRLPNTDVFVDSYSYQEAEEVPRCTLLKVTGSINFANRENLRSKIESHENSNLSLPEKDFHEIGTIQDRYLILDISGISDVDSAGAKSIGKIREDYKKVKVTLCLTGIQDNVSSILRKTNVLENFDQNQLFHSMKDAISFHIK